MKAVEAAVEGSGMGNTGETRVLSDSRDDCVQLRLASGETNVLTTDLIAAFSTLPVSGDAR